MATPPRGRTMVLLVIAAVSIGVVGLVSASVLLSALAPSTPTETYHGTAYYHTFVSVPPNATASQPLQVEFHNASFVLWWPEIPPGTISSGVYGVSLTITEPSGTVDQAASDCAACGDFPETWFSADNEVGISYTASEQDLGNLTLLVAE
jgi:hypothetical protein